ncbi:hypothetical protein B4U80_13275, partial [Leptotrombidium deliense]
TFVGNNKLYFSFDTNQMVTDRWSASYSCNNQIGLLNVQIPSNASIGSFGMILTEKGRDGKRKQHIAHRNVIIIFNPYHKGDDVYMQSGLQEYLENTVGMIWMGNTGRKTAKTWLYAQVSNTSNDYDDWGILVGRWDGLYEDLEMGPTPVNAVKMGIVDAKFDLPFVYSEVNADIVYWKEESIYLIETSKIGAAVVTKQLNSNTYIDITHDYKAKEKSKLERNTLRMIAERMGLNHPAFNSSIQQRNRDSKNIAVDIECAQNINLGENLPVKIRVKPQTWSVYGKNKLRKVEYTLILKTKHYDGKSSKKFKLDTKTVDMPKNGFMIKQVITPEMYDSLDFSTISIKIRVRDVTSKSFTLKETEVEVKHPPLHVNIKGQTKDKKKTLFVASFRNPMPTEAKKCALVAESEMNERVEFTFDSIKGNSNIIKEIALDTPPKENDLVLFSFNCDKIDADMVELRVHHPNVKAK